MYFVETIGEVMERAWVPGNVMMPFKGGHQFKDLPVLRRRGKQKEKDYHYTVYKQSQVKKWHLNRWHCSTITLFLPDTQELADCVERKCGRS